MTDGVQLEATVTLPQDSLPVQGYPGVIFVHGYGGNKSDYAPIAAYLASRGYASLLYSVRGQGNSGGLSTTMGERERLDLLEVIRFFRSFAGIDSARIGVAGGSQGGVHAWMAATSRIPGVAAIATLIAPPSFAFDLVPARCFKQQLWAELSLSTVRYDPQRDQLKNFVIAEQYDSVLALVAPRDLEHLLDSVRIPVIQMLGWADALFPANGAIRAIQRLSSRGVPIWSYFGTGGHGEPLNLNETLFLLTFITNWFDHWLRGAPLERAGEPYVVFADDRPGWPHRESIGWPPQPQGGIRLFLTGSSISTTPPISATESPFTLTYDPAYTPSRGWADGYAGTAFRQAFRASPARFLSTALIDTMNLTGVPRALIFVRSSATRYQAHVRIFDVAPTDTGFVWIMLTRGTNGIEAPYAGAQISRLVECVALSHRVVPGHRIGLEVTSLDMYDADRAHIIPYFAGTSAALVSNAGSPSYVDLPLIGSTTFTFVDADRPEIPGEFMLDQNYPNPFNGISQFGFRISELSSVKLQVFDLLGREVAILLDERKAPGVYTVRFDAGTLASGTYVYRLTAGNRSATRRMVLVR